MKVDPDQLHRMIAERAYFRYVERGYAPGDPVSDWLAAEAEIRASLARSAGQVEPPPDVTAVAVEVAKTPRETPKSAKPAKTRKAASSPRSSTPKRRTARTRAPKGPDSGHPKG